MAGSIAQPERAMNERNASRGGAPGAPPTGRGGTPLQNDTGTEARVRAAVKRATGRDHSAAPVKRLAGHASNRSYWRVGEHGKGSHTVMVMPPDAKPEEVTKGGSPVEL